MKSSSQVAASPGRVLAVLCGAAFMASLDVFIVNVAFDSIGADFPGSSLSQLSWVLNAYAVVFAALLVPAGRIADRYGGRASRPGSRSSRSPALPAPQATASGGSSHSGSSRRSVRRCLRRPAWGW
jgi:MFS family permease